MMKRETKSLCGQLTVCCLIIPMDITEKVQRAAINRKFRDDWIVVGLSGSLTMTDLLDELTIPS
jgi:hypothetical protein